MPEAVLARTASAFVGKWVGDYLRRHPNVRVPESQHNDSFYLALLPLRDPLAHELGGLLPYWWLMFDALKETCPPDASRDAVRLFGSLLEAACDPGHAASPPLRSGLQGLYRNYRQWLGLPLA